MRPRQSSKRRLRINRNAQLVPILLPQLFQWSDRSVLDDVQPRCRGRILSGSSVLALRLRLLDRASLRGNVYLRGAALRDCPHAYTGLLNDYGPDKRTERIVDVLSLDLA